LTDKRVTLPEELTNPRDDVSNAETLVSLEDLALLWRQTEDLGLPDLDAIAAEHRAIEQERAATLITTLDQDVTSAEEQSRTLWSERQEHPCHACPRRDEHRDYLAQTARLDQQRAGLEESLGRQIDLEEERLRNVIRGIRNVLHRFGYLHRGYPTEKADMLAEVFDNDGLILCEIVDRGILDRLPPEDVAEVFSWFSFDREYRYGNRFVLPDRLVLARRRIEDVEHAVLSEERSEGLVISEGHNPNFYGAARAWCGGSSVAEIGERIELSEGDLVLTFNKTIDLMRQVAGMLGDVNPEHPLRRTLRQAESLLRRDIVEQSLILGFAPIALPEIARSQLELAKSQTLVESTPKGPVETPRRSRTRAKKTGADVTVTQVAASQASGSTNGRRGRSTKSKTAGIDQPPGGERQTRSTRRRRSAPAQDSVPPEG